MKVLGAVFRTIFAVLIVLPVTLVVTTVDVVRHGWAWSKHIAANRKTVLFTILGGVLVAAIFTALVVKFWFLAIPFVMKKVFG